MQESSGARAAIALYNVSYFFVGMVLTVLGPLVPEITSYYARGYTAVGMAMVWNSVAYLPAVLFGGAVCGRFGARRVVAYGLFTMAAGYGLMAAARHWWLFVTAYCVAGGVGFGMVEAALNSLVMDVAENRRSAALNILHVCSAAGAVVGPVLSRTVVAVFGRWQPVYLVLLLVFGILMAVFSRWRLPESRKATTEGLQWSAMAALLTNPVMIILAAAMTCYVGTEIGISNWLYSYITVHVGGSAALGAALSSLFWLGLGLGRLISAFLSRRYSCERILLCGALSGAAALGAGLLSHQVYLVVAAFFLTGLFISSTFPNILAVGGRMYPTQSGPVAGVLMFFAGLGTMVFPPAMGQLADQKGIWYGMALALGCNAALALCTGLLAWHRRRRQAQPQVPALPNVRAKA